MPNSLQEPTGPAPSKRAPHDKKICLVTGGTSGIGRAMAERLVSGGHTVLITSPSTERATRVAHELRHEKGHCVGLALELSDQGSVRSLAHHVQLECPRLDVLINNAARWSSRREVTVAGLEKTWAANVLGHFLLTELLSPLLVQSAPARVVFVASGLARGLSLDDLHFQHRRYRGIMAYSQSKQAQRMLTRAFSRRLAPKGVTVNSAHPGFTRTPAFARGGGGLAHLAGALATIFGQSPEKGADTPAWLAESAEVDGLSGGYFQDRQLLSCEFSDERFEEALVAACRWEIAGSTTELRRAS